MLQNNLLPLAILEAIFCLLSMKFAINREAVIKMMLRRSLDEHYLAKRSKSPISETVYPVNL